MPFQHLPYRPGLASNTTSVLPGQVGTPAIPMLLAGGVIDTNVKETYWRLIADDGACDKCKEYGRFRFLEYPVRPHPNCDCEIKEYRRNRITWRIQDAILVPPEVDIPKNIAEAKRKKKEFEAECEDHLIPWLCSFIKKCDWLYEEFNSGQTYDYKKHGIEYEDFGNFHFGVYAATLGVNDIIAQMGGGFAQLKEWTSSVWWVWSYFDDPHDNVMIIEGQESPLVR